MFKTIREIQNMPKNTQGRIFQDTSSQCIELCVYENPSDENPVVMSCFNIDWIGDKTRVDWLAQVISGQLREAYWKGKSNQKAEIKELTQKLFKSLDSSL